MFKTDVRGGGRDQGVASRVGHDSEAAFNRAFKPAAGSPPAAWRTGTPRA
jgi:hypothetical protein